MALAAHAADPAIQSDHRHRALAVAFQGEYLSARRPVARTCGDMEDEPDPRGREGTSAYAYVKEAF